LLEVLRESLRHIPDTRQAAKAAYTLPDCYMSGFAMFFLQDPSLLEFQRRFQHTVQRNNLSTVFGVRRIPGDSQLREVIDEHDYRPLYGVFAEYFRRLQRGKHLEEYRFLGTHYLVSMDGLYSKQSFIREVKKQRMSFILAAKPSDHQSLMADIEGLRRGGYLSRLEDTDKKAKRSLYEWVNAIPLNADPGSDEVNFVEFSLFDAQGKRIYHNSWVTDIEVDEHNVREVVRGGRARWKIENEGFNTLKNHGYHLEHNVGHGSKNMSEAFFVLNLLAFLVHQILELTDRLYQSCRAGFSARREFWNAIRASFHLLLFDSWEQVLLRMNSPPSPAFGE
jgi:hypothetical protein